MLRWIQIFIVAALASSVSAQADFRCTAIAPTTNENGGWGGWCHHTITNDDKGWAIRLALDDCLADGHQTCRINKCEECSAFWGRVTRTEQCHPIVVSNTGESANSALADASKDDSYAKYFEKQPSFAMPNRSYQETLRTAVN